MLAFNQMGCAVLGALQSVGFCCITLVCNQVSAVLCWFVINWVLYIMLVCNQLGSSYCPPPPLQGRPGMSDISLLSGMSGLSFCVALYIFLSANGPFAWLFFSRKFLVFFIKKWVIEVCFQPWCNPLWLTGLKVPANHISSYWVLLVCIPFGSAVLCGL